MTNSNETKICIEKVLGWRQHYNNEIQIEEDLTVSETGEYFQDFHPALQLNIISQTLERGRDLSEYLKEKTQAGITGLINDVETKRIAEGAKDILASETLLNKYGWANDGIFNEGRFVGFMFETTESTSLAVLIKSIGFQFTIEQPIILEGEPQTETGGLDLYVYHTSQLEPLLVKKMDIAKKVSWNWIDEEIALHSRNKNIQGGRYFIGYYQADVLGQAINYTDFNWLNGHCGSCDGGKMRTVWNKIKKYTEFMPIYVPSQNIDPERLMFDENAVMIDHYKSWGMNFKISVACDYTDFLCNNRKHLKNALGLKVAYLILKDIKFSQQFNYVNEDMKNLIIRDLEGDKDTHEMGIALQLKEAIKNAYLDTSGLNGICLPCSEQGIDYGVA